MFLGSSILGIPGPVSGAGTAGMAPVVEGTVPVTAGIAPVTGGFASDGATVPSFAAALGLSAAPVFSGRECLGLCVMKMRFSVCGVRPSLGRHGSGNIGQRYMPDAGRGLYCTRFLLRSKPFISLLFLPILSPASPSNLPRKKALYVNKESFSTFYSHKEPFYTLTLSKGHIFCVKYAVKLLVPSSRNESPAHFVDSSFRDDSRGREAVSRHVSLRTSRNGSSDHHQLHSD